MNVQQNGMATETRTKHSQRTIFMSNGANGLSLQELDDLFKAESQQETPPADGATGQQETPPSTDGNENKEKDVTQTQAFAHRLKEEKEKARKEAREEVAAALGYESYEALQKQRENKLLEDKGFDPEQVSPLVDELVKKRLEEDPRMQELAEFKKQQAQEFAKRELSEISKLTGIQYTSLDQLPQDVIESWRKTGNLKQSYIALHGEELILQARSANSRGTTEHLQAPTGQTPTGTSSKRPLTEEEKNVWRFFNPSVTEEELNKKTVDI